MVNFRPMDDETLSNALSEIGRRGGRVGGQAKVAKGLAKVTPEKREEIRLKSLEVRRAKALEKSKPPPELVEFLTPLALITAKKSTKKSNKPANG